MLHFHCDFDRSAAFNIFWWIIINSRIIPIHAVLGLFSYDFLTGWAERSNMLPKLLERASAAHAQCLTFWSRSSGVFEQEGGHVGQAVGENRASSDFSKNNKNWSLIYAWRIGKNDLPKQQQTTISDNVRHAAGGPPGRVLTTPCFKLIEIWKKFFHHFYFAAVRLVWGFFMHMPGTGMDMGLD